jgi:hypothetical protein
MIGWLFRLKRKYLQRALDKYAEETGVKLELEKSGIPPLRFWWRNRKGDCWGRVRLPDGSVKWVRLRDRLFGSGSPLTFFDA